MARFVPEVSVIIPAKDVRAYIYNAVNSVPKGPYEIIVVNDGSTDGTAELLGSLAAGDDRIKILQGRSRGASAARNLAIEEASAPLIAFLDADDIWLPGKLEAQIALHRANPEIGFSFTDYLHVGQSSERLISCFSYWSHFAKRHRLDRPFVLDDPISDIIAENIVGTSTVVASTDLLRKTNGFRTDLGSAEDWDLWTKLAANAPVGCLPQVLAEYLCHRPGCVSASSLRRCAAMHRIARAHAWRTNQNWAQKSLQARLASAEAEASADDAPAASAMMRMRAFRADPSMRHLREAAAQAAVAFLKARFKIGTGRVRRLDGALLDSRSQADPLGQRSGDRRQVGAGRRRDDVKEVVADGDAAETREPGFDRRNGRASDS